MLTRKAIPPRTPENLLPPNREYDYFAGACERPFRSERIGFDLVNATWLADASLLAYADEDFVRRQWEKVGAVGVRSFVGASTQAYVITSDQWILAVFRGTQVVKRLPSGHEPTAWSDMVRDWKTDANVVPNQWPRGGLVHKGFKEALEQVWIQDLSPPSLHSYLAESTAAGSRTLWFTGHSLGAALATLAAHAHGQAAGVYTFGSPRVGTPAFVESFQLPTYRVVNATDIVARVPPAPYEPVGELHYIRSNGDLSRSPSALVRSLDWIKGTVRGIVPGFSALADHAPIYYATHLWNACVDEIRGSDEG